jgi:tellurite resistance protein
MSEFSPMKKSRRLLSKEMLEHNVTLEESGWEEMQDYLAEDELDNLRVGVELWEILVDAIIRGRQRITGLKETNELLGKIEGVNLIFWIDKHITLAQLRQAPEMAERVLRLANLDSIEIPSEQTNKYIEEATRCYVYGLIQASVAMSRAALEQALKERLDARNDEGRIGLADLITDAGKRNVLSPQGVGAARKLKNQCNEVMHKTPQDNSESGFEILSGIRSLIEEAFSSEVRF